MWELWESQQQQRKTTATAKIQERESKRGLEDLIQSTIEKAEKLRPSPFGTSKKENLSKINENRKVAQAQERQQRGAAMQPDKPRSKAKIKYLHEPLADGAFPESLEDLFGGDK